MLTTVDMANSTSDGTSTGLRPNLSLKGPKNTRPIARPHMLVARPICTIDAEVSNTWAIDGRVGRYMSVTKGPKAESKPRNISRKI